MPDHNGLRSGELLPAYAETPILHNASPTGYEQIDGKRSPLSRSTWKSNRLLSYIASPSMNLHSFENYCIWYFFSFLATEE